MSDISDMSTFWSGWVSLIVLGSIFGCAWLLWATRKSQKHNSETEQTMGHEFDGIEEYDNPLPKWWMHMFLGTIIFGLIYLALYPGLGTFKGLLGWTSTNQWEKEVDEAQEKFAPLYAELAARPLKSWPRTRRH
jgi:cytochrome c oxidase cbb3-type subunit 3